MTGADRHAERRRGTAFAEMALLLPLAFVLFIGVIDFGRVFYSAIAISHAARAGVQYGAQDSRVSGDFAGMRQAATDALGDVSGSMVTACRYCQCANGAGSCTTCSDNGDGCTTGSGCLSTCSADVPRIYVKVGVNKVFTTLFPYPGLPHTANLNRTATMRVQ
jgi:Flp pilus assembly protein TadG